MLFIIGIIFYALQKKELNPEMEALKKLNNLSPSPALYDPNKAQSDAAAQQQAQANQSQQQQQQQQNQIIVSPVPTLAPEKTATRAAIITLKGTIKFDLYSADAPGTVANFISKAQSGFYKNLTFHRVEDWVIQGGDPLGTGAGGGKMLSEINAKPFVIGSVGVARGGDIRVSNDAQFFIVKSEASHLNNQYVNFGQVVEGMDIVNSIAIGDKIQEIKLE